MIVVFCVIAVVALISLYDYFNTRSWQQVTSTERNDAVFEQRNREYGAFVMRRDYNKRLMLIVLGMTAGVGVLYAATHSRLSNERIKAPKISTALVIFDPNQKTAEVPEIPESKPEPAASAPSTAFNPVIVDNPVDAPAPLPPSGPVGPISLPGDPGFTAGPPGPPIGGGGGIPPTPPPPPAGPELYVDEPAEYPGGRPAMMSYLSENIHYPEIAVQLGLEGKCYLKFVVSKKGDISEVTVQRGVPDCKECDKEAVRVVKGMPIWRPGKIKGKAVDSYFNLPVAFTLAK